MGLGDGLVDPELGGHDQWVRSATEPLGVGVVGRCEGVLAVLVDCVGGAEMHRRWGVPGDPGMPVNEVVLVEEPGAELAGVGEGAEAGGEVRQVLEGLELCLGEGVVIGHVRRLPGSIVGRWSTVEIDVEEPSLHGLITLAAGSRPQVARNEGSASGWRYVLTSIPGGSPAVTITTLA